jgi:hypothetical protein
MMWIITYPIGWIVSLIYAALMYFKWFQDMITRGDNSGQ